MIKQVMLGLILGGFMLLPSLSHAESQCTTTELDLVCPEGQYLEGISSAGVKQCVDKEIAGQYTETRWYKETSKYLADLQYSYTSKVRMRTVTHTKTQGYWINTGSEYKTYSSTCVTRNKENGKCECPSGYTKEEINREKTGDYKKPNCTQTGLIGSDMACTDYTQLFKYSVTYMCRLSN